MLEITRSILPHPKECSSSDCPGQDNAGRGDQSWPHMVISVRNYEDDPQQLCPQTQRNPTYPLVNVLLIRITLM